MIWYKAWLESRTRFLIAAALIAVVIITAVTAVGTNLSGTFTAVSTSLK